MLSTRIIYIVIQLSTEHFRLSRPVEFSESSQQALFLRFDYFVNIVNRLSVSILLLVKVTLEFGIFVYFFTSLIIIR